MNFHEQKIKSKKNYIIKIFTQLFPEKFFCIRNNFSMGPRNSACESGLAVKSDVVKSGKINIVKAC